MNEINSRFRQRLMDEAAAWVEKELARRMEHAREAIEEQARVAMPEIGPARAGDHVKKALAYAREEIRMDLEMEAQEWIEERQKEGPGSPDEGSG